jgi:dolichyl-phosphate-mannose-protein mannosyltransferase
MTGALTRKDYLYAAALSLLSLVLCAIRYWFPPQRYFDEVYYPRSAAEYLQWQPQYEWTHPPLTKLLIALSMLMWGGVHSALGDTGFGWRFLNLVVGAATVFLIYAFAKRLTSSTPFAALAGALLVFDGFHFTQARIATPEITVAFFALLILYCFYRYWEEVAEEPDPGAPPLRSLLVLGVVAAAAGCAAGFLLIGKVAHQTHGAPPLIAAFATLTIYAAGRCRLRPRPRALWWLLATGIACGLGGASKWNALFPVVLVLLIAGAATWFRGARWRIPVDVFAPVVLSLTIALYLASYIPFFLTPKPVDFYNGHDLTGFMDLQNQMFTYHDVTVTHNPPHPYSSKWWEWPILYQPVAYYYKDTRTGKELAGTNGCCLEEIIAIPNPLTWWLGLVSVPFLGYLAWRNRNRGYLLLFSAYFAQWLPWAASPRMLFEYHFFPNDAIILLADTIGLKWLWDRYSRTPAERQFAEIGIGTFVGLTIWLFVFFYPVLAGDGLTLHQWQERMWFPHWVRGPG